jgi:hypothetical protein
VQFHAGKTNQYNIDEIFESIEGDDENMLLKLPPEIWEQADIEVGDTVSVQQEGNSLVIKKV